MKKCFVISILILIIVPLIYSHPHVFMETSAEFIFNENELEGFELKWVFDEMFSAIIMEDCDKNKDGIINEKEKKIIEKDYFSSLEDHNYFCHIIYGGEKHEIKKVEEFNAYIGEDKKMIYELFVPMNIMLEEQYQCVKLTVYDDTYYIAVGMSEKDPVHINGIKEENYDYKCIQNSRDIIYFGQTMPTQIILNFKK
ncbi:DUF1007 family protein [Elusimicrobiota bacterium]